MIYFFIALFFSSLIVITFKLIVRFRLQLLPVVFVNYITATLLGLSSTHAFFVGQNLVKLGWFPYALAGGLLFIITFLLMGISTRHAGLAITSVAGKMSVVIPVAMGFLLLSERPTPLKVSGIFMALMAFYFVFGIRKDTSPETRHQLSIFPLLLFLSTGLGDSLIKYAQVHAIGNDFLPFLTVVFGVCLLLGILLLGYQNAWNNENRNWKNLLAGVALGSFNWYSTVFLLQAMQSMEASVIFPAFNAGMVAIASLSGTLLFGEKLRPLNWLGIFMAIAATLLVAGT
ncbi:MAG: EamA family transporter [Bacteroidales bacterium]